MNHTLKYMYGSTGSAIFQASQGVRIALKIKELGGYEYLQLAGLLHNIGHVLTPPTFYHEGVDTKHEQRGFMWLKFNKFPDRVIYPIRNHVNAKRYMCSTEWGYYEYLSRECKESFKLQGGFMTSEEKKLFTREPYFRESLLIRRATDQASNNGAYSIIDFNELVDELVSKENTQ